jgi:hypothetical protein
MVSGQISARSDRQGGDDHDDVEGDQAEGADGSQAGRAVTVPAARRQDQGRHDGQQRRREHGCRRSGYGPRPGVRHGERAAQVAPIRGPVDAAERAPVIMRLARRDALIVRPNFMINRPKWSAPVIRYRHTT